MQSPWEGARHGIPSRGEGLGVVRGTRAEAADCQGRNLEFGTGKLEKSHEISSSFSTNYWPVGLVIIRMEEGLFSRNYCRVGLVVIRMEEGYYCVV